MGGLLSSFTEEIKSELEPQQQQKKSANTIDVSNLDTNNKHQIIEILKALKSKNINLSEEFITKMKDIELNNKKFYPMCIELYSKLLEDLGEHVPIPDGSGKARKRTFFVRPKFDVTVVKATVEVQTVSIACPLYTDITKPQAPKVAMKTSDILLSEYTDSFNNNVAKKDMMGISKKILRDMPIYLKTRLLNAFNVIFSSVDCLNNKSADLTPEQIKEIECCLTLISGISLGRASYVYKAAKKGATDDIASFRQIIAIPNA